MQVATKKNQTLKRKQNNNQGYKGIAEIKKSSSDAWTG